MSAALDDLQLTPARREAITAWLVKAGRTSDGAVLGDSVIKRMLIDALAEDALTVEQLGELIADQPEGTKMTTTAQKIFSKGAGSGGVRVKRSSEQYDDTRHEATHVRTGRKVFDDMGQEVRRSSQKEIAMAGALLKFSARRAGISVDWTEHDQALLSEQVESHEWASYQGEPGECKIFAPGACKAALLDDSNSGGLEAAPIYFDEMVIVTPLLTGELFSEVQLVPISRGRRIEGATFTQPTVTWNEGDAASGTIFDSTSQIAAMDSTVFDVSCHVIVGKNFLSDSPLQIGNLLVSAIGERMAEAIETVIAKGDGTTQPQGIMGASGTTSVSFGNVAATVSKYLELMFAVPKQLRVGPNNFAFGANETTYRRARSIATGVTGDTRLVYGMSVEDYAIFQRPFKIIPSLANNQLFAGALSRYRLYRRLGTSVEWTTQGQTLQSKNEAMLSVRQRWAGRPTIPSAFAVCSTAEG
jgi:HK97 family phage major capsid protein